MCLEIESKMTKSYQCTFCEKKCTQKSNLKTHIKLVHDKAKVQCHICLENIGLYSLKSHIARFHSTVTYVKCDKCEKTMKNSHLKKHIAEIHNVQYLSKHWIGLLLEPFSARPMCSQLLIIMKSEDNSIDQCAKKA